VDHMRGTADLPVAAVEWTQSVPSRVAVLRDLASHPCLSVAAPSAEDRTHYRKTPVRQTYVDRSITRILRILFYSLYEFPRILNFSLSTH